MDDEFDYEPYEQSIYNGDDLDGGYHDGHWEDDDVPYESDEDLEQFLDAHLGDDFMDDLP